jgi:hypothetical protein
VVGQEELEAASICGYDLYMCFSDEGVLISHIDEGLR